MSLTVEDKNRLEEILKRTGAHREAGITEKRVPEEYEAFREKVTQKETVISVPGAEAPVRCVITKAKERERGCPVHVNMHGGGFVFLQDGDDDLYCTHVAAEIHGIVVDIDYASSRDYPYPEAFQQCYGVMRWVYEQCERWGADSGKVSMGGHSAGGCLVAAIAMKAAETGDFKPCLQILDYAALDNYSAFEEGGSERSQAFSTYYCDGNIGLLKDPYVSPAYAGREMMAGQPPALIINAQNCPFCERNEAYGKRMVEAGNEVTMKRFLNSRHGFTVRMVDEWQEAQKLIIREILHASKMQG